MRGRTLAQLPAVRNQCGAFFQSGIGGAAAHVTVTGCVQRCPFCGGTAKIADGVFDLTKNTVDVLQSGEITASILERFGLLARSAYAERATLKEFAAQADEIHPALGELVRKSRGNSPFAALLIMILVFWFMKSCTVNVNFDVDVNRLIDQATGKDPKQLIETLDKQQEASETDTTKDVAECDASPKDN